MNERSTHALPPVSGASAHARFTAGGPVMPDLPSYPIVVGVTGHRDIASEAQERDERGAANGMRPLRHGVIANTNRTLQPISVKGRRDSANMRIEP